MIKPLVMGSVFCTIKTVAKKLSTRDRIYSILRHGVVAVFLFVIVALSATVWAANSTDKQLEALATRVGKTFWIASVDNRTPAFLSKPAPNASSFLAPANESFEITELVGWKARNPYYKVRFDSGKEGYIRPEAFHEEFNMTILTVDPQAEEKRKAVRAAEDDKQRIEWIEKQPWSEIVKEAAIKRQPMPGMNMGEIKKVLGNPTRVMKNKGRQGVAEEHWFYANGPELVFHNGLLIRVEPKQKKEPGLSTEEN
jgi:hypothetical protein